MQDTSSKLTSPDCLLLYQVIVSGEVAALDPSFIWLGGGAETVKLRVGVQQLITALSAFVADANLTTLRDDL